MVVNSKKLIIKILLKKEFIKKELPCYYNILCKYQSKNYYYYNIPNTKKIIKSNKKIQRVNKMLIENMLALDANLYKKIRIMKTNKLPSNILNKNRKNKFLKNKCNMISIQTTKDSCEKTSQKLNISNMQSENIDTEQSHTRSVSTNTIIPDFDDEKVFHYRSKSVTFVEDSLEQIRLFNMFDPPNSITMTPTHYSTGKIDSNSLIRFHRRNRYDNFKVVPFTPSELKKNALYDHPVRSHRSIPKMKMPYNLKMDFSFGDPISSSPKSSTPSSPMSGTSTPTSESSPKENSLSSYKLEKNSTLNYELRDTSLSPKKMVMNYEITKPKSPVLSNNYSYSSNVMDTSINFVNNKEVLYNTSLITVNPNKIPPLAQVV